MKMFTWENSLNYLGVAIDILIVSYVIYKLLVLIRGTRAIQLLKGMMVILITWFISSYFNLRTLQWLMSQAFTYGVLAIIVIFQPELRRALEQLGRGKLFNRTIYDNQQGKAIGEIIKAVNYLAKRRIGALIILERETGLSDYIETGIILNSDISSQLLINIFIPNTPLHDGAVIIRKDEIMAAACYLPLSENPFISKELGTRHRAAIGLSEISDAVCLIVSEETGQISLALNGEIIRDLAEENLHEILINEMLQKTKSSNHWLKRGGKNGKMVEK